MLVIGLLFIAAAAGFSVDVVVKNHHRLDVHLFGTTVSNASVARVFLAGGLTAIVAVLGVVLMASAAKRSRRRRATTRQLLADQKSSSPAAVDSAPAVDTAQ